MTLKWVTVPPIVPLGCVYSAERKTHIAEQSTALPGMPSLLYQMAYQGKMQVWGRLQPKCKQYSSSAVLLISLFSYFTIWGLLIGFLTHIGLVLLQDDVPWELRLWYGCKLFNNVGQGLQTSHPQLVTVVCGCHEGHTDKVWQMEHQQISWLEMEKETSTTLWVVKKKTIGGIWPKWVVIIKERDLSSHIISKFVFLPDNSVYAFIIIRLVFW